MDLGDAKYTVNLDDRATSKMKGLETSMDSMGKKFAKTGAIMVAAGAAITAGLFKMADSYTKAGDEVAKMAKRTGFTTESLSELRHAAKLSGSDISALEKGVKRMSSSIEDAKDGLETYTRSFDKLGISIDEIKDMAPEEQFWTIANALADLEDETTKAALAQDFFGRAGTDLLPMLAAGTDGIAAMRQEAHDLGIVFDAEAAAKAEAFQDSLTKLKGALAGLGAEIIDDLTPIMMGWIDKVTEVIGKIKEWAAVHPDLAKHLMQIGAVLAIGGAVLLGLGALAKAIVAINTVLIIMHGLSGPKGWAILAAGILAAAGTILLMKKLMAGGEVSETEAGEVTELGSRIPQFQYGGVVPGAIGSPVPIMAHGGERFLGAGGGAGSVNINVGNFMGDESSLRDFTYKVQQIMKEYNRGTSFSGINRLGYWPGSSSV